MMQSEITPTSACSRWLAASVVALALIAYGNSYPGAWIFDDPYTIPANPGIGVLWPPSAAIASPPGSPASGRPLTALSFNLNAAVSGLHPASFRFVNVLIHAANALLLFLLVRRLLARMPRWRDTAPTVAWMTAALWAVHPLNTSSVTYISQRAESLMALFFLAALYALARLGELGVARRWSAAALVLAWCAVLAKDVGAMLPLLVIPFDRAFFRATWREAWHKRKRLFVVMLIPAWLFLGITYLSDPRQGTVRFDYQGINSWTYLCTQAAAIVMYVRKVFWPDPLILDYGWPIVSVWREWLPHAVALTSVFAAGLWCMVRKPAIGFPVVMFFAVLAPSSSVIPVVTEIMAEHRMYLPSALVLLGAVLLAMAGLRRLARNDAAALRWAVLASVIAGGFLLGRTIEQNALYRDPVIMWRHNCEVTPLNRRSHFNLGHEWRVRGLLPEAVAAYGHALRLSPDYPDAFAGMSYALYDGGDYQQALPYAEQALRFEPQDPEHYFTLAMIHAKLGDRESALAAVRSGLLVDPNGDRLKKAAVVIYFMFDQPEEALNQLSYWANRPRQSPEFIQLAAELAESAGKSAYAEALRQSLPGIQ